MFSRSDVAGAIDRDFEPAWVSVRPVPTVNIDFGNGNVITRTLHGNVATLVMTADGLVMDAIPGILTPRVYLEQLAGARELARLVNAEPEVAEQRFRGHHGMLAAAGQPRGRDLAARFEPRFVSKSAVESRVEMLLAPGLVGAVDPRVEADAIPPADLSTWTRLQADTQASVNELKRQIHAHLAREGRVPAREIVKWLYREVLHADLDDPYLGLGPLLFNGYPFQDDPAR